MTRSHRLLGWFLGLALVGLAVGCGQKTATPAPAPSPAPVAATGPADGKAVFSDHCAQCHAVAGSAAPTGKIKGPDLTHVGSDPTHTAAWIAEHVKDPKIHKAKSRMPAFESKLTPEEIKAVAEYLAAMK